MFVSDASLARAVSENPRDGIRDHSRSDGFLQTVHGFGYRFASAGVAVLPPSAPLREGPVCWLVGRDCEFRLGDGEHLVGREPGVSIRLDSPKVSRHHARVTIAGRERPSRTSAVRMGPTSAAPASTSRVASSRATTSRSARFGWCSG